MILKKKIGILVGWLAPCATESVEQLTLFRKFREASGNRDKRDNKVRAWKVN